MHVCTYVVMCLDSHITFESSISTEVYTWDRATDKMYVIDDFKVFVQYMGLSVQVSTYIHMY